MVRTDADATDDVKLLKKTTTVAMDFGLMRLASGDQVRLYGTPGQQRFDFMWDILTENALGLLLMLRATAPDPLADLRHYVNEFRDFIDRSALVVGITHTESVGSEVRRAASDELVRLGLPSCVMDADARVRTHMATLVKALIYAIEPFHGSARR